MAATVTTRLAGFQLLTDFPAILQSLPKESGRAVASGQRQALVEWQLSDVAPGLNARFTWAASKDYGASMRRRKYGTPTLLRLSFARAGRPMPNASTKEDRTRAHNARSAPNQNLPWYWQSGGTRSGILKRKPTTRRSETDITSKLAISGLGINFLGGSTMHGVTSARWVWVPVTYSMTVYKDSVHKAGAYKMWVTRRIGHWAYTYASRSYKEEFEDTSKDLPWIAKRAEVLIRDNLRNLTIDNRGRLRRRVGRAIANFQAAQVADSDVDFGGAS